MVPYSLILIQCACHTCSRRKWKGQTGFLEEAPLAPISENWNLYVPISIYFTPLDLSLFIWRKEIKRRKKTRDVGNTATKTATLLTLFTLLNTAFTTFSLMSLLTLLRKLHVCILICVVLWFGRDYLKKRKRLLIVEYHNFVLQILIGYGYIKASYGAICIIILKGKLSYMKRADIGHSWWGGSIHVH